MKQCCHKIVSVVMAFVVFFSTMSFTIDMHYCGDTLVDTAIFKDAKGCGMEIQKSNSISECTVMKKNCCSDEELLVKGQDELQLSLDKLTLDQQQFVASYVYSYIFSFDVLKSEPHTFDDYPPPNIVRQIYKLDETYLI